MTTTTRRADVANDAATPSRRDSLRLLSIGLATIGLLITVYLVYSHFTNTQEICLQGNGFNCDLVQNSVYSRIGPLPIQYLGLGGYLAILLALLFETRVPVLMKRGKVLVFAMTLFGFLYSAYLTMIEAFVLHAWCMWCLISAITMTLLFAVSSLRLWREVSLMPEDDDEEDTAET